MSLDSMFDEGVTSLPSYRLGMIDPRQPANSVDAPLEEKNEATPALRPVENLGLTSGDELETSVPVSRSYEPRAVLLRITVRVTRAIQRAASRISEGTRAFASRNAPLLAILGTAALLRVWGLAFGYPGKYRPDEEYLVSRALGFHSGDLNPHFFFYPTLYMYVLSAVFGVVRVLGDWTGAFGAGGFTAFLNQHHFAPLHVMARATTASLGVAGVWAVYHLGRIAYGRPIGLLAAGVLAVNFSHVRESHFATTDVPMTLLLTLAFAQLVMLANNGRIRHYVAAGFLIGFATATKYPAVAALVPLNAAVALRALAESARIRSDPDNKGRRLRMMARLLARLVGALFLAGICFALALFLGSPYLFIDTATVRANLAYQLPFAQKGVTGLDMPLGFAWLLQFGLPQAAGAPLMTLFLIALLVTLYVSLRFGPRRDVPAVLLASFVIALCIPYVRTRWIFLRYAVPLMPIVAILSAALVAAFISRFLRAKHALFAACAALGLASIGPAYRSAMTSRLLAKADTRQLAREWIENRVPKGAEIAIHRAYTYGKPELPHGYRYVDIEKGRGLLARWALVDDSPIRFYSPPLPRSSAQRLHERGRLRAKFDPFVPGLAGRAVYDPADAFYLPVSGLLSVRRPGPVIWIYEVAETPPKPRRTDCGLFGRYYANTSWEGDPELTRIDPYFMFSWHDTFPVSTPLFSAEWVGRLEIPSAGSYAFRLESDDGSTLEIDDRLVVDNGGIHQPVSANGVIRLDAGLHTVRLRYVNAAFTGELRVFWTPPDASESTLDCEALHPPSSSNKRARAVFAAP